jgi:hypothetical protein
VLQSKLIIGGWQPAHKLDQDAENIIFPKKRIPDITLWE